MLVRTCARAAAIATLVLTARAAGAQGSVADHIRLGDQAQGAAALRHFEMAIAADSNSYTAQWKASAAAAEAGEAAPSGEQRTLYRSAERYARRAVQLNPRDAEGHAALARALGRTALTLGTKDRVKYAGNVRAEALEALKYNAGHASALHIMGMWNAEIMRLNGMSRFMAKNFLGGQVFGTASWKDAVRYMEQAVSVDPDRLVHRIDLAEIYADTGDKAKARATFEYIVKAPAVEPADAKYKQQAERALKSL
jgi:tetratricopeptide (TPR) repeat protein